MCIRDRRHIGTCTEIDDIEKDAILKYVDLLYLYILRNVCTQYRDTCQTLLAVCSTYNVFYRVTKQKNSTYDKEQLLNELLSNPIPTLFENCKYISQISDTYRQHILPLCDRIKEYSVYTLEGNASGDEIDSYLMLSVHTNILQLSLIHISEPTRLLSISYAVFCLK